MSLPTDYEERVYAGVLGKIIGVYLGRPFEGWRRERIEAELGDIDYYVHDRLGKPLIVADDDISGTFTFVRALEDHGASPALTAEQIGDTWLNYLIEERTILWWGGMGNSTEHTAYLRLKHGMRAPASGSIETNGQIVAEQIGAQIFIDGWGMVAPGEPALAAKLAREAAAVSHDGAAIHGAQVLAAMEAAAFVESDLDALLDTGLRFIPDDCLIAQLIRDVREWHAADGDWRQTFSRIEGRYGYDRYGGNCHMIPNHAVVMLGLLYGEGDFQRSLRVANSAGWDTDCNSGNVGCLVGIQGGLAAIDAGPDFRGPVADRLFKISADGGDAVSDAVRETERLCALGRQLAGETPMPARPFRYHFELPGSVQGFMPAEEPDAAGACRTESCAGHSASGSRSLAIHFEQIALGRPARAGTQVFATPDQLGGTGYHMTLSPSVYGGQQLRAEVELAGETDQTVNVSLFVQVFGATPDAEMTIERGESTRLTPGDSTTLEWLVPDTGGLPIVRAGVELTSDTGASGTLYLGGFGVEGEPETQFLSPSLARHAQPPGWTMGVDRAAVGDGGELLTLIHDEGRGLLITGHRSWEDYTFSARVWPHMTAEAGIAVRVGGMRRGVALLLVPGGWCLLEMVHEDRVLAEGEFDGETGAVLSLTARGAKLIARIDDETICQLEHTSLRSGGVALVTTEGRCFFRDVRVSA